MGHAQLQWCRDPGPSAYWQSLPCCCHIGDIWGVVTYIRYVCSRKRGLDNPVLWLQSLRKTSGSLLNHRKILWAQEPARAVPTSCRCLGTQIHASIGLCPIEKALWRPAWKGCTLCGAGTEHLRLCMCPNWPAQCSAWLCVNTYIHIWYMVLMLGAADTAFEAI